MWSLLAPHLAPLSSVGMKTIDAHSPNGKAGNPDSRAPLDPDHIAGLLRHAGVGNVRVEYTESTGSTNADLAARVAGDDVADRTVLLADEQVAGKGRLNRRWSAPSGSQFICSIALLPNGDLLDSLGELPLLVGVAVVEALRECGVPAVLKWPNDVQVIRNGEPLKLAGILVEAVSISPLRIVVGIGLNLSMTPSEFDAAGLDAATSLVCEGVVIPDLATRENITVVLLRHLLSMDDAWRGERAAVQRLRDRYREFSSTLGASVRAELPGGTTILGRATDLGPRGELIIETDARESGGDSSGTAVTRHMISAGDVVHLRLNERGI